MKSVWISVLFALLPASGHASLIDLFPVVCLSSTLAEGRANTTGLKKIDPDEYGLRGGQLDYVSVFVTPAEDYFVQVFDLEDMQCTVHHFDYDDAELELQGFTAAAQRFELTRRPDCDQTAGGGQKIVYYQFQEESTVTTVWLNTDEKERVTWMGLMHSQNGSDCS